MAINTCVVAASLRDLLDTAPEDVTATLVVRSAKPFMHGATLIGPFEIREPFDEDGNVELEVIETDTPAVKLEIYVVLDDGIRKRVIRFNPAIVPDEDDVDLSEITQVDDFSTF